MFDIVERASYEMAAETDFSLDAFASLTPAGAPFALAHTRQAGDDRRGSTHDPLAPQEGATGPLEWLNEFQFSSGTTSASVSGRDFDNVLDAGANPTSARHRVVCEPRPQQFGTFDAPNAGYANQAVQQVQPGSSQVMPSGVTNPGWALFASDAHRGTKRPAESEGEEPVKKKSGRPRKNPAPIGPKRKPGRPKKVVTLESYSDLAKNQPTARPGAVRMGWGCLNVALAGFGYRFWVFLE